MSTLSKARNLPGARVIADAGCSWGATPPVIPDYLGLSVGGTLSIGGISPTTYRCGAQVDNVEALQVVTGEGQIVTCSKHHRADLFDAVLAGQGQCAVIARAVIKLVAAPARVRAYSLLYPDVVTALADSDRLVDEKRFDGVMLFTFANGSGGDAVILRGTKHYSPPATPDDATMLAGLNFVPGVTQIDDLTYVENFSITTGPFPPLRHPAICVVLPAWRASRFRRPLMPIPAEEKVVGFALLRFAQDAEEGERMLAGNRQLFEESRALGGTLYPFSAVKLSRSEWRQHYGHNFDGWRAPSIVTIRRMCSRPGRTYSR